MVDPVRGNQIRPTTGGAPVGPSKTTGFSNPNAVGGTAPGDQVEISKRAGAAHHKGNAAPVSKTAKSAPTEKVAASKPMPVFNTEAWLKPHRVVTVNGVRQLDDSPGLLGRVSGQSAATPGGYLK